MRRWPRAAVDAVLILLTTTVTVMGAYVGALAVLAWFGRWRGRDRVRPSGPARHSFAIVVPAHDEEGGIGATLRSLGEVTYPAELSTVHVVADHCTDDTAGVARAHGAVVHERTAGDRGKGPAISWWIDRMLAGSPGPQDGPSLPDAIVVIDADTTMDPDFLTVIDAHLSRGARVVQGYYAVRDPGRSWLVALRAAALCSRHYQRPLGRHAVGASAGLFGNGMAFVRDVLVEHRMTGHLTEDIELHLDLVRRGERVVFAADARVEAEMPATLAAARDQQVRWERGRMSIVRRHVPRLLVSARRDSGAGVGRRLETAMDQLVPPTSVLLVLSTGVATGARLAWRGGRLGCTFGVAARLSVLVQLLSLLSALRLAGAPRVVYRWLAAAPALVLWKTLLYVATLVRRTPVRWTRTERATPGGPVPVRRCLVEGVQLDPVTMEETLAAIAGFVEVGRSTGRTHQVATVNVDYLVNLDDTPGIRPILQRADLVTVDGMPVVWATHRHGAPVPDRVTGADLVPRLARLCAERGYRLHLMGAAPGVAQSAADILVRANPALVVRASGCPPLESVDDMDEQVLDELSAWRPDIVLVALGHPKQELWTERYRTRVGAPVFIGVGGSLDFVAGTTRRAPVVLQRLGLEWAHRLVREPRRLAGRYLRDLARLPRLFRRVEPPPLRPAVSRTPASALDASKATRRADGSSAVVVDVASLGPIDARVVSDLVFLARRCHPSGIGVVLVVEDPSTGHYLEALKVHGLFEIVTSPEATRAVLSDAGAPHD